MTTNVYLCDVLYRVEINVYVFVSEKKVMHFYLGPPCNIYTLAYLANRFRIV